jgi:hypothetical protein
MILPNVILLHVQKPGIYLHILHVILMIRQRKKKRRKEDSPNAQGNITTLMANATIGNNNGNNNSLDSGIWQTKEKLHWEHIMILVALLIGLSLLDDYLSTIFVIAPVEDSMCQYSCLHSSMTDDKNIPKIV